MSIDLDELVVEEYFPSLELAEIPEGVASPIVKEVGFAGEGWIDDLAFGTVDVVTGIDFTLTLDTGVSAVTYTLEGNSVTVTKTAKITHDTASKIEVTNIDYLLGYVAGSKGTGDYSADVTIDAKAVTFNEGTEAGSVATTAENLGITTGVFAGEAITTEQLKTVFYWGSSKGVSVSKINGMNFSDDGDPASATETEKVLEEAYLLNCSPAEVETKKLAFKFTAFDPTVTPVVDGTGYNGDVVIEGATTLSGENGPDWDKDCTNPKFYRARLVFPGTYPPPAAE